MGQPLASRVEPHFGGSFHAHRRRRISRRPRLASGAGVSWAFIGRSRAIGRPTPTPTSSCRRWLSCTRLDLLLAFGLCGSSHLVLFIRRLATLRSLAGPATVVHAARSAHGDLSMRPNRTLRKYSARVRVGRRMILKFCFTGFSIRNPRCQLPALTLAQQVTQAHLHIDNMKFGSPSFSLACSLTSPEGCRPSRERTSSSLKQQRSSRP